MTTPSETTSTVNHLYAAVLAGVHDTAGTERAALLHGLADRLNGYADALVDDPCHAAGLRVMREVFDVVTDREDVPTARVDALTPSDVADLYDQHIGPAIDRIEDALLARD